MMSGEVRRAKEIASYHIVDNFLSFFPNLKLRKVSMLQDSTDGEFVDEIQKFLTDKHLNIALMDSLPYPAMLIRKDRKIIAANKAAKEVGVEVGSFCWDTFGQRASISDENREYFEKNNAIPPEGIKCTFCRADEALVSQEPINKKIPAGDVTYDTFWIPLMDEVYLHYAIVL